MRFSAVRGPAKGLAAALLLLSAGCASAGVSSFVPAVAFGKAAEGRVIRVEIVVSWRLVDCERLDAVEYVNGREEPLLIHMELAEPDTCRTTEAIFVRQLDVPVWGRVLGTARFQTDRGPRAVPIGGTFREGGQYRVEIALTLDPLIFTDGFESGDVGLWTFGQEFRLGPGGQTP